MYSVTFKNDVKFLSTGTITLGVLKKYFNIFYHYKDILFCWHPYTKTATFSAVQLWLLGTIAPYFSVPPFVSLTFYLMSFVANKEMLHLRHKPGTRVALHGFLHPVITVILLNSLWNLNHLTEKQKMPFPSSNHCKETKSLH